MQVSAREVSELRQKTGAGMMDCKKALVEQNGDMDKAIEYLRKKNLSAGAKKAHRVAAEGMVDSYVHMGGKIGVLLEVNAETDFVARNDDFKQFVHDVAMHIAASSPGYVSRDEVPADEVAKEKEILLAQAADEGKKKPPEVLEKMVEGRLNKKFFAERCLLEQPFVKEPDKKVEQVLNELIGKIGEKIVIRRFVRFQLGEGLEKKSEDFASEVAAAAGTDDGNEASGSYYKVIDGHEYDRHMLEIADAAVAGQGDGRISKKDAEKLLTAVKDANNYTDVEKATMKYIRDNYQFTKGADEWIRTEIRKWAATK